MENIKLYNRDNANLWLEHIDKDLWQLKSENPEDLQYVRVGFENDNKTINFIDPSGGPFICVGCNINENYKVNDISLDGFIIKLEKI